jgi:uncharacterized SAM-binding protein YcdF (DUF218 family)
MKNWFDRTLQICGVIFIIQMCFVIIISFFAMTNPEGITSVLAKHLIKEDALVKSDAIVVLGGFENEKRFNYGIELYKHGYGNKMIVSGAGDTGDIIEYMTSNAVEKEDILIDQYATTTYENAVYVKKLVDDNHIKSFILVTTPDQSKRARQIFDKVFSNSGIRILSSSNKDSEFEPGKIMNSKNAKEQLIIEWVKLLYYKTL